MSPAVRRLVVVGVVAAAVVVGGALLLGVSVEGGPPDPEALQDRVVDANRSLDTYEATVRATIDAPNDTTEVVYTVAVDRPDRINITYHAPENVSGDVLVRNRSGLYSYDDSRDRLVPIETDAPTTDPIESLVRPVTANGSTFQGEDRIDGSSGVVLQYSAGDADVGLRIGGSAPARRFSAANGSDPLNVSVWVDPERNLPVRARQRYGSGNETAAMTVRVTNLTTGVDFDPERFRPPTTPETNVSDQRISTRTFQSRAALVENVSMRVPDPSVPDGFSLHSASSAEFEGNRSVALTYRDGQRSLVVVKRRPSGPLDFENASRVDLDGVRGYYVDTPTGAAVVWNCGGASYQVTGLVGREDLIAVARSVDCERDGGLSGSRRGLAG